VYEYLCVGSNDVDPSSEEVLDSLGGQIKLSVDLMYVEYQRRYVSQ
jgi:hypothetical protein